MHSFAEQKAPQLRLQRVFAAVKVEKDKKNLLLHEGVHFLKEGTMLTPLPEGHEVSDHRGIKVRATGRFYITTETIDPYHMLIDVSSNNSPF